MSDEAASNQSRSDPELGGGDTAMFDPSVDVEEIANEVHDDGDSVAARVLQTYAESIDADLIDAGLHLRSVSDNSFVDQTVLNRIRNGVFALCQLEEILADVSDESVSEDHLRAVVEMFVAEEAPDDCALSVGSDHPAVDTDAPRVRFAHAITACETPEDAATSTALGDALADIDSGLEIRSHELGQVTGVFTNLLNATLRDVLAERRDYHLLAIYPNGCLYVSRADADIGAEEFDSHALGDRLSDMIASSHPSYSDPDLIGNKLNKSNLGLGKINGDEFFFSDVDDILYAAFRTFMVDKAADKELEYGSLDTIKEAFGIELTDSNRLYSLGRAVNFVRMQILEPMAAECDVGVDHPEVLSTVSEIVLGDRAVGERLKSGSEEVHSTMIGGGKWEYALVFADKLVEEYPAALDPDQPDAPVADAMADAVMERLDERYPDWRRVVREQQVGELENGIAHFIEQNVRIDGRPVGDVIRGIADDTKFEEYSGDEQYCRQCGGTMYGSAIVEANQSLTGLKTGYSKSDPLWLSEPPSARICRACRVEYSLREVAVANRVDRRVFIHLVPDSFYTPFSWRVFDDLLNRFDGDHRQRLGDVAEAMFDASDPTGDDLAEALGDVASNMRHPPDETGQSVAEALDRGFDPATQFGTRTLSFNRRPSGENLNDTTHQFLATYTALVIASYTGTRVRVSKSPLPDVGHGGTTAFATFGETIDTIRRFYGQTEVGIEEVTEKLQLASAMIMLAQARSDGRLWTASDGLIAKQLRFFRTRAYPGSTLLMEAVRNVDSDDEGGASDALKAHVAREFGDAARTVDRHARSQGTNGTGTNPENTSMTETTEADSASPVTEFARLSFEVVRPRASKRYTTYAIQKPLRACFEVVKDQPAGSGREDLVNGIAGKLEQTAGRDSQTTLWTVGADESDVDGNRSERFRTLAEFFVDEIYLGLCDGDKHELRSVMRNSFADAFYAEIIRLMDKQDDEQAGGDSEE